MNSTSEKTGLEIGIDEDNFSIKGKDGLDLKISGRVPDKWLLLIGLFIASALGLNEVFGGV